MLLTRIDAMDKAQALFETNLTRVPTEVEKQVAHLKELHEEKFSSIQTQFIERDARSDQTSKDAKVAVDAALQAAKEAVAKSETSTIKQIDQMTGMIQASNKGIDDKFQDVKDRLTRNEGKGAGMNAAWGYAIAAITAAALVIGLFWSIHTAQSPTTAQPQIIYVPAPSGTLIPTAPPNAQATQK